MSRDALRYFACRAFLCAWRYVNFELSKTLCQSFARAHQLCWNLAMSVHPDISQILRRGEAANVTANVLQPIAVIRVRFEFPKLWKRSYAVTVFANRKGWLFPIFDVLDVFNLRGLNCEQWRYCRTFLKRKGRRKKARISCVLTMIAANFKVIKVLAKRRSATSSQSVNSAEALLCVALKFAEERTNLNSDSNPFTRMFLIEFNFNFKRRTELECVLHFCFQKTDISRLMPVLL